MCRTEKATADRKCAALAAADVRNSHTLSVFFYSQDKNVFAESRAEAGSRARAHAVAVLCVNMVILHVTFMCVQHTNIKNLHKCDVSVNVSFTLCDETEL